MALRKIAVRPSKSSGKPRTTTETIVITEKQSNRKAKPAAKRDYSGRVFDQFFNTFSDPVSALLMVLTLYVAIDFTNNPSDNIVVKVGTWIGATNLFGAYLIDSGVKIVGMMMLLPSAWCCPPRNRMIVIGLTMGIAYVMPVLTLFGYFSASMGLRVYFTTSDPQIRSIIVMIVAAAAIVTSPALMGTSSSSSTTTTNSTRS